MIEKIIWKISLLAARWLARVRERGTAGGGTARQRIYCANHTSHLDALVLLAALPAAARAQVRPVAAAEYWRGSWWRRYLAERVFRTVFIERDGRELNPLSPAFEALRSGESLIFFPEGTRGTGGGTLQLLKPGLYYLARAFQQVEIVPVWVDGADRILPKRAWLPWPERCWLTFGPPLRWDGREDAGAFLARVRAALEAARHQTRQPELVPHGGGSAILQP